MRARDLSKSYGAVRALDGASFEVEEGVTGLLGSNGAGKTTSLKLFLGLIDLQDTVMGRKARNTGHKALRARAVVGLADTIGWERAHGVFYTGVPDMAVGPLYYSLYDAACVVLTEAFPDAGKTLKQTNQTPLGFVVVGRSPLDDEGRPFPLLHMRRDAPPR